MQELHMNPYFQPDGERGDVLAGMAELTREIGLQHFCIRLALAQARSGADQATAGGTSFPTEWQELYRERAYRLLDPIIEQAGRSNRPFLWGHERYLRSRNKRQRKVLEEAWKRDIRFGLSIPVHDARGSVGVVSFTAGSLRALKESARESYLLMWSAALDAFDFMSASPVLLPKVETGRGDLELTLRERECLLWTLEGKTAEEVGKVLCLSVHTVNHHVSSATRKLGCVNKHHAALRAMQAGLL